MAQVGFFLLPMLRPEIELMSAQFHLSEILNKGCFTDWAYTAAANAVQGIFMLVGSKQHNPQAIKDIASVGCPSATQDGALLGSKVLEGEMTVSNTSTGGEMSCWVFL